jgi:hypothetical protein
LGNKAPEGWRMVEFFQVCQLMSKHIVQNRNRRKEQPPVKIEIARSRAAPPTAFLFLDGNSPVSEAKDFVGGYESRWDDLACTLTIPSFQGSPQYLLVFLIAFLDLEQQSVAGGGDLGIWCFPGRTRDQAKSYSPAHEVKFTPILYWWNRYYPLHCLKNPTGLLMQRLLDLTPSGTTWCYDFQPAFLAYDQVENPGARTDSNAVGNHLPTQ